MNLNECPPVTEPEDIRRKLEEKEAVTRGTLWEQMGCPISKLHMPIDEYMKSFKGRHWFVSTTVLAQAQMALRIILCPKCYEKKHDYGIEATQFYTSVEDDVMTVFPAVGHFVCHWCGFEEWHPLRHDPRVQMAGEEQKLHVNQAQMAGLGNPVFGSAGLANQLGQLSQMDPSLINQQAIARQIGKAIGVGIKPGMGPIWGMTEDEQRAMHRLYQQTKKTSPPPIVQSKEEAEMLLKLAPVERRQAIIQKLRDLGKI